MERDAGQNMNFNLKNCIIRITRWTQTSNFSSKIDYLVVIISNCGSAIDRQNYQRQLRLLNVSRNLHKSVDQLRHFMLTLRCYWQHHEIDPGLLLLSLYWMIVYIGSGGSRGQHFTVCCYAPSAEAAMHIILGLHTALVILHAHVSHYEGIISPFE